jgi:hypothetical protein
MTESAEVESRLRLTFDAVAAEVPDEPALSWDEYRRPTPASSVEEYVTKVRPFRSRRLVAAISLTVGLGVAGTGAAAATGAFSHPTPPLPPPPPQWITTGKQLPQSEVLANSIAAHLPGVTRTAIKTVPYGVILHDLQSVGVQEGSGPRYPGRTDVPVADPVDVIAAAGSVQPPNANQAYAWGIWIVNPVNGDTISGSASNDGTWPSFFDQLPNRPN